MNAVAVIVVMRVFAVDPAFSDVGGQTLPTPALRGCSSAM